MFDDDEEEELQGPLHDATSMSGAVVISPPPARRREDPLQVVNLRGDDAALFLRVKAKIVERAGCDVANSAVIRAALLALLDRQVGSNGK